MEVQPMDKEDAAKEEGIYRVTVMGSRVNFLLLLLKFFAGIVGYSAAVLVDAVCSLSDFMTDITVIVFVRISSKPEDEGHDHGHSEYETLATAIISIVLLFIGFGVLWNGALSIYYFLHGSSLQEPGTLASIAALVSVVFREAPYRYTVFKGKKLNPQMVVASVWYHRSGALLSIGTVVGIGGTILSGNYWRVFDLIAAVVVSFFTMKVTIKLLVPRVNELLEKSLPADVGSEIQRIILSFPGVSSPHHLRTRRMGSYYVIEMYMRMDGNITLEEAHRAATAIGSALKKCFGRETHVDIHAEPVKEVIHSS